MLDFKKIEKQISSYKVTATSLLQQLESKIFEYRLKNKAPIYLTKWRIKSPESIYIKIKRNNYKSIEEINDILGFKVLCLFEQDIIPTHAFLIEVIDELGWELMKFESYNMNEDINNILGLELYKKNQNIKTTFDRRASGYKSLHYLIQIKLGKKNHYMEIQLRTLLQDVWSELEHNIIYKKGKTNNYIKKDFKRLAKDIGIIDETINNLKDINDKEESGQIYLLKRAGPHRYFNYEDRIIPYCFKKEGKPKQCFNQYIKHVSRQKPYLMDETWINEAWRLFNNLKKCLSVHDKEDPKIDYCLEIEEAFLLFCENKYKNALLVYEEIKNKYPNHYVVYFRIGEIHLINKEIETALINFDISEKLLSGGKLKSDLENRYRIKVKLAFTYKNLSEDFIDFAIDKIMEAKDVFLEIGIENLPDIDYLNLLNNICYYLLEKFIIKKSELKFLRVTITDYKEKLSEIEDLLDLLESYINLIENYIEDKDDLPSNIFDTLAWYYYQVYLHNNDKKFLDKSRNYCTQIYGKLNYSPFVIESANRHLEHIQEIIREQKASPLYNK